MAANAQIVSDLKQRGIAGGGTPATTLLSLAEGLDLLAGAVGRQGGRPGVQNLLARAINRDVLPRMVLAHRGHVATVQLASAAVSPSVTGATTREVEQLVEIAMARGTPEALCFVERRRIDGMTVDAVCLDLMAPAARLLGRLWDDDLVDFGQVTIATDRLRQVMRSFSLAHQGAARLRQASCRALLVPGPGDQHSFGLAMVADFFGRAGWHVWSGVPESNEQLLQMVRREHYGVIGFSVGSGLRLDGLSELIRKVRRLSCNRAVGVMVGGPVFQAHPELVAAVGADATASDGRQAVLQAHRLLDLASRHL